MKILVTGSAGFIGSELTLKLLERGNKVIGIDNHNNYYDIKIKKDRLARHLNHSNYKHYKVDISNKKKIKKIFAQHKPKIVINLAAQAGVRHSISYPQKYIDSNIIGFFNILENCRLNKVNHLVYASTSSVYGENKNPPFSEIYSTDHPLSLYAATKKSNELMAYTYSHIHNLRTTGLRFFTVYGPWGRPDMSLFKFTNAIFKGKKIDVFNKGKHKRDFTYIDDVIYGILKVIYKKKNLKRIVNKKYPEKKKSPWSIYNIGNNKPIKLLDFISILEKALNKKAKLNLLPLQPGDVTETHANIKKIKKTFGYNPSTQIKKGVLNFVEWFKKYYNV
jgi:UDP-glucuronate 4-epimerase